MDLTYLNGNHNFTYIEVKLVPFNFPLNSKIYPLAIPYSDLGLST